MPTTGKKDLSIYIHVPFCKKKCPYCHFYSIFFKKEYVDKYVESIVQHLKLWESFLKNKVIKSIYFGGGTPSLIGSKNIEKILSHLIYSEDCEITIETNPNDVTLENFKDFKKANINRVSLGVQSFDDNLLKVLNRDHSSKKALDSIFDIFTSGIENISIDLMYDIPNQTKKSFENTLNFIDTLPIKHISLYNLTFEENTLFYKNKKSLEKYLPNEEISFEFLNMAIKKFEKLNFNRYEISAFSKKGFESIHNKRYWQAKEFLGFGPSAFSYFNEKRFKNISNFKSYIKALDDNTSPIEFEEKLKYPDNINELIAINLRILEGIDLKKFEKEHQKIPEKTLNIFFKNSKFVSFENNKVKLTKLGLLFYDSLAEEII
ncbi:MAG: radical SAM family heme chaperone HemW [Parachlamydiales bacterium]|nr:radical SAM family heme chaperone HemW [Parachlamydiales bacterium]